METKIINDNPVVQVTTPVTSGVSSFILSNTVGLEQRDLETKCIIPVFAKDNESTISHPEFINAVQKATDLVFSGEKINLPAVRVSHPVKGRIPEAMGKPAIELMEREKTIYYERMAFAIEIPTINELVNGNHLSLVVGGVRAYNCENLYGRKGEERFRLFLGFKNSVCINLCISTDGFKSDVRVRQPEELLKEAVYLLGRFSASKQLNDLRSMSEVSLSETQFAQFVGKARMYQYLPPAKKKLLPKFHLQDSQVSAVIQGYFKDKIFARDKDNRIDLWRLYNLFTGANKSSYIDSFLERGQGSHEFTMQMVMSLKERNPFWYLR